MTNALMLYSGAVTLGALHAFEPGHGKTLIAAYMIGTRGRAWDGFLLGAIVTFTHTFSVVLLGLVAKILSTTYSEEDLHNWLGLVSAGIILTVGFWMLRRHASGKAGHHHFHLFGKGHSHEHHHPHSHPHAHEGHDEHHHHHDDGHHHPHTHEHGKTNNSPDEHSHEHHHPHEHPHVHDGYHAHSHEQHEIHEHMKEDHTHHEHDQEMKSKWELLMLGISGGIIPCPAAIATLLAAIAARKPIARPGHSWP
ncbi:MAG: hypothetical protein D3910_13235 [Candidatus Electrothrix sp. ATG2]|nr:hypothetical protein [Candidatus Electrothrix sp. ATG2]